MVNLVAGVDGLRRAAVALGLDPDQHPITRIEITLGVDDVARAVVYRLVKENELDQLCQDLTDRPPLPLFVDVPANANCYDVPGDLSQQ